MSDDLVEFVRQCLARDERAAREAAEHNGLAWTSVNGRDVTTALPGGTYSVTGPLITTPAAHIARHDPARVLAEVAARRAIVEQHRPIVERKSWDEDWTICGTCRYDGGLNTYPFPCPTLRALAQPYAGEPGWQEEWRP